MISRPLIAFSLFELKLFFSAFLAVLFTFVMPCAIYAVVILSSEDPVDMAARLLPLLVGMIMVFVGLFTLAVQVVLYRETGFYKRLLVTRIDTTAIALSNAIRGYSVVLLGLVLLLVEAGILIGGFPAVNILGGLLAIVMSGAGIFLLSLIPACFVRSASTMFTWATILSYVVFFFSGTMPPIGGAGAIINGISQLTPGYHALVLLRNGFGGDLFNMQTLVSAIYMAASVGVGLLVVRRYLSWR